MKDFDSITDNELEGCVYVIPKEFGGRETPIFSGYRGQFFWPINGVLGTDWIAESYFDGGSADLGKVTRVKIKLAGSIVELGRTTGMPLGRQFALREGSRVVAVGVITASIYESAQP